MAKPLSNAEMAKPFCTPDFGKASAFPMNARPGACGTCRARVVSGDVDVRWKEAPGGARLKPEKGDILMCQTRARSGLRPRSAFANRFVGANTPGAAPRRDSQYSKIDQGRRPFRYPFVGADAF